MGDFDVPFVIDKAKHSARLFRRQAQKEAGAGTGVDRPGDLKVQALSTPGAGFRVAPGGATVQSRDTASTDRESYGPVLSVEKTLTGVPGTGSGSGRRDLVIIEITDPEIGSVTYPPPPDPVGTGGWLDGDNFCRVTIIQNVDSLVPVAQRPVRSLNQITSGAYANVTGVTLAAITYPASTSTVTNAMIEDLRVVHSPLSVLQPDLVSFGGTVALTGTSEIVWPAASQQIRIPERANELTVMASLLGMLVTVNWVGVEFRLRLGNTGSFIYSDATGLTTDTTSGGTERVDKVVPMRVQIPAAMRGTTQPLVILAKKTGGTGTLSVTNRTVVKFDSTLAETTV
ncbi:hypothetical protein MUN76_15385 [Leucobacter rhizosphaerae]|uniref:Minor tail protein n=1 Tax=Leucobacter rhizosphaerae TaxID=2932245 RepID=A0ABY4FVY5_9MICO|nr:hypothetical protein [Leucobacter rhizosphaerae]UOQ60391.1 hypothetical protein MUN76_15385 [Leucobacter rhizosphaerae]